FSATLVEPKTQRLLSKYALTLTDLFHGPEAVRETMASRSLPSDLQQACDNAHSAVEAPLPDLNNALARLDHTLVEAAGRAASKMRYQLERLRRRAARAEVLRNEFISRHAGQLSNALYPHKGLQERTLGGIHFLS